MRQDEMVGENAATARDLLPGVAIFLPAGAADDLLTVPDAARTPIRAACAMRHLWRGSFPARVRSRACAVNALGKLAHEHGGAHGTAICRSRPGSVSWGETWDGKKSKRVKELSRLVPLSPGAHGTPPRHL